MNAFRSLLDSDRPAIAVSFTDTDPERLAAEAATAAVDVAELRIDRFADTSTTHVVETVRSFGALHTLATIRSRQEGGTWTRPDTERLNLFSAVIPWVDGVDIELSSVDIRTDVIDDAHRNGKLVIVSYHNFEATPDLANSSRR